MNRGKAIAPDSSIGVREFTKWTDEMDFRLLSAMLDEARLGNRVDGSWTTQAYNNIVEALRKSGLIGITKNNVKNRQKSLKDRWHEVHDLFNGLSGFAWDESIRRFSAEPEVWDELLTVIAIERRNDLINEQINVMRRTSTVQYSESDIWEMLVCMNLPDEQIMVQCYDWLCNNPSHVRRLFGLPPHLRLNQLLKLMGGSD
ncbi:hypothetical protein Fmac_012108 [Flemingia macrophylla]|uniref:Myb/SANT-like domain-containing protein n=1 Tax=Flemingia macrophylla TaxID=520843 RepID=A0ABD1MPC3_9FABA